MSQPICTTVADVQANAMAALCVYEEVLQYKREECPYPFVQNAEGAYSVRDLCIDIGAKAETVWNTIQAYHKTRDESAEPWDSVTYDWDYIPAFMNIAIDEYGCITKSAVADMEAWRIRECERLGVPA